MLRQQLNDALKTAMLGKDPKTVSTVRLILAALKDRDIAARPKGLADGIPESVWFTMDIVSRCEAIGCARDAYPSPRADGLVCAGRAP